MANYDLLKVVVIPCLPHWRGEEWGDPIPDDLVGAQITSFGTSALGLERAGLIIDYIPCGRSEPKRLILGFNEQAMWEVPVAP